MTWMQRTLHHWRLTIGYIVLVVGLLVGLNISLNNQQRIEEQAEIAAARNCHTGNELKEVLRDVLLIIVGPPEADGYERRLAIFENIEPLLEPIECPPAPPYGDDE